MNTEQHKSTDKKDTYTKNSDHSGKDIQDRSSQDRNVERASDNKDSKVPDVNSSKNAHNEVKDVSRDAKVSSDNKNDNNNKNIVNKKKRA